MTDDRVDDTLDRQEAKTLIRLHLKAALDGFPFNPDEALGHIRRAEQLLRDHNKPKNRRVS